MYYYDLFYEWEGCDVFRCRVRVDVDVADIDVPTTACGMLKKENGHELEAS